MRFWKLAIVCLFVFTVSADLDTDIELISDLAKLHSLRGAIASRNGASGGGSSGFGSAELELFDVDDETVELISSGGSQGGSIGGIHKPVSVSKPATSKPVTPSTKPVTAKPATPKPVTPKPTNKPAPPKPSTKPVSTKPVTRPTKPVTTKPVTPTKPVATPTKPLTQHSTKPATNPTKKPVTTAQPSTKPLTTQPTSKPTTATPQQSYKRSMADNQNYIKQLWQLENERKEGFNKKTGMWTGNPAPEKGGKIDYGPGLKLPYKAGGYT